MRVELVQAVNWNALEDKDDKKIFDKLANQFWLPEKVLISGDLPSWRNLTSTFQLATMRVFAGLTLLDTIQSRVGVPSLMEDVRTPHEAPVLANIIFMEAVHAKTYSYIFQTLCPTTQINEAFLWSEENQYLQEKSRIMQEAYHTATPLQKKAASVLLESFLFYSGFFMPLYLSGTGRLPNTGDLINLILRDEAIHGSYIGYKFRLGFKELPENEQAELKDWVFDLVDTLYDNEVLYTRDVYEGTDLVEEVKPFLRYNANRALDQLGFEPLYDDEPFHGAVLAGMDLGPEAHDFFSGAGSSYIVAEVEDMTDDDFDF